MKFRLNAPNILTTLRGLLVIPLIIFILQGRNDLALVTFILAALTELDGTIARKFKQDTEFGKIYDPLVDGFFIGCALLALLYVNKISLLLVVLLVLVNIPRVVLIKLFYTKSKKVSSTKLSKATGVFAELIIPLAIISFNYLNELIIFTIVFTLAVEIKKIIYYLRMR